MTSRLLNEETQKPRAISPSLSRGIYGFEMLAAIHFDDQLHEIHPIRTNSAFVFGSWSPETDVRASYRMISSATVMSHRKTLALLRCFSETCNFGFCF